MSINPNFLIARKGSCVFIPCQIDEAHYSDKIKATTVVWYFEPHWDNISYDFTGHLLFDSSKSSEDHMALTSPNFWGRVRFVGDLSRSDCSLMITQLQASDSGKYGARVAASVGNHTWRQMLFDQATVDIQESLPEPRIEAINVETQEQRITNVKCSVPYNCPSDSSTLTLRGLEKHHLFPRNSTIEGGMLQINVSFVPTWEDDQKILTCLLSSKDGTQRSSSTLELDVKYVPKDVQVGILNDLPLKEGDNITLNCSVGSSIPKDNWYNWVKSDLHSNEMTYSGPKLLTFPATPGPGVTYRCEACNVLGCSSSPPIPVDVHFAPKEVKIQQKPAGPIHEGSHVKLSCQVGPANPQKVNYTWYHNGDPLRLDHADEMLIISGAVLEHSGSYWCEVSNDWGSKRSPKIVLHVICMLCNEIPLSISPSSLSAWKGSCVLIPCQVAGKSDAGPVNATAVAWYFEPVSDYIWHDHFGRLLYDSSKTAEEHAQLASPSFQGRVKFVGDLNRGDCSLMVTQLRTRDNGTYGARVAASVANHPWQLKWFLAATVHIRESPPKPRMDVIPAVIQEGRATQVICSIPYDCTSESITLTITDTKGNRLSLENATIENRKLQAVLSFEATREDHRKKLRCSLKGKDWAKVTHSTLELDVKFAPKNVRVSYVNNHPPIKQGDAVMLRCEVGEQNPRSIWYNWLRSSSHTVEMLHSGSKVLAFSATKGPVFSYTCEACNVVGCASSSAVTVDVYFAPEEVHIWREPKGQLHEGDIVKLRCEAGKANPQNFSYAWYHDGRQLALDSASEMLTIDFVLSGHSGSYWCEISNSVGTSRSPTATLNVICE
ncbi:Sialoadhesin [Varanus komodoensis]|nr:Sialoadhesin [Varanus komodoensis]